MDLFIQLMFSLRIEINNILNLNEDNLGNKERLSISCQRKKSKKHSENHILLGREKLLDQQIRWWSSKKDGKLSQFCMVAVTYLESRKK